MISPLTAIAELILSDPKVNQFTSGRVYASEIPKAVKALMPCALVLVLRSGGGRAPSLSPLADVQVDIECYGKSSFEREQIYEAVAKKLQYFEDETRGGKTRLYSCIEISGALESVNSDADWQNLLSVWSISMNIEEDSNYGN